MDSLRFRLLLVPALLLFAGYRTTTQASDNEPGFPREIQTIEVERGDWADDYDGIPPEEDEFDWRVRLGDLPPLACRLVGEFERQGALLLGCNETLDNEPELFVEIIRRSRGRVRVLALVSHVGHYRAAKRLLRENGVRDKHVHYVEIEHNTMWARDYGPVVTRKNDGRIVVIDALYDFTRIKDDSVPGELARHLDLEVVDVPIRLDGGNLLANGEGLALTTTRLLEDNGVAPEDETRLNRMITQAYGLRQCIMLEPLGGEPTGHVDMFATFVSPTTVVVASCDPRDDPENAAILDRNARRLEGLQTLSGRLRVVRMPMPDHDDGIWRTWTNVIFANGALLVPLYDDVDETKQRQAITTYSALLPGWEVIGLDVSRLIESAGALHCISMNIGPLDHLPQFPKPRRPAEEYLDIAGTEDPASGYRFIQPAAGLHRLTRPDTLPFPVVPSSTRDDRLSRFPQHNSGAFRNSLPARRILRP